MAIVDDDMKDADYIEEAFSLEDVAWADSCLCKDMDSPKSDWTSVKGALFEILVSQGFPNSTFSDARAQPSGDAGLHFAESVIDKTTQSSEDEDYYVNKHGRLKGKKCVGNVFRPNYTEDAVAEEKLGSGLDLGLGAYWPTSDIFQVWDLRISDEQDDFVYQLNNIFDEVPPWNRSTNENSSSQEDESVDSLITAIGGLSLVPYTK